MKKKVFASIILALTAILCLGGCHGDSSSENEVSQIDNVIEIWISDAVKSTTQKQVTAFLADNPDLNDYDIIIKSVEEDETANSILMNTAKWPDLYGFAQDQLANLVAAEAITPVSEEDVSWIQEKNDEKSVAAASMKDTIYAYPLTSDNGYFLYYDQSVVSDPSTLEGILADCEKAGKDFCMSISSGWYQASFFFATGCKLEYFTDDQGNFIDSNITYATPEGLAALKAMIKMSKSKAFKNLDFPSDPGNCGAIVDGTWDSEEYQAAFGSNYRCAKLPTFLLDGKSYQMSGFGGFKLLGVKPQKNADKLAACQKLARYLSDEQAQLDRFESRGWGPSNKAAQASEEVKSNPALTALNEQMPYMVPQGQYPNNYWILTKTLGDSIAAGKYNNHSDAQLMEVLQKYQKTSESLQN